MDFPHQKSGRSGYNRDKETVNESILFKIQVGFLWNVVKNEVQKICEYLAKYTTFYTMFRKKVIYLVLPYISHSFWGNFTKLSVNIRK